jgi:tetratricopeptide (TPR) repeat protein
MILLALVLVLGTDGTLAAQDNDNRDSLLGEARNLAANGQLQDAAAAYNKWLAENPGHPTFGIVLMEAADSQLSIERSLELLRVYTPRVQDLLQQEVCRASQIDFLEMLGRTEQALGLLRSFPPTPRWLYRQAQLLYQQGLTEEAEKFLEQALTALQGRTDDGSKESGDTAGSGQSEDRRELQARIWLLLARIHGRVGKRREAEALYRLLITSYGDTTVASATLLAYYELLIDLGRGEEAVEQLDKLARIFPDSPELALAQAQGKDARIVYAPSPSRYLPRELPVPVEKALEAEEPEAEPVEPVPTGETTIAEVTATAPTAGKEQPPPRNVLVQTGSFRDPENAHYMIRDLKASGFDASIMEKHIGETVYYRVVIGPAQTAEKAQEVLMKLKDASFEGVLLFPE